MQLPIDVSQIVEDSWAVRTAPARAVSRLRRPQLLRQLAHHSRAHLGCGPHVFDGWANLDLGGGTGVVPYDLTARLPFRDSTLSRVYTEHFIEHVSRAKGARFLQECARALAPGGVLRVSTPDLLRLVEEYRTGHLDEWSDQGWSPRTPAQMLNEGMRKWGHQFVYDEGELTAALLEAGFRQVRRMAWRESEHDDLRDLEQRTFHGDLIVEASR